MKVSLVKDGAHLMGIEITNETGTYFASVRQDIWPGIRIGSFPCRSDGTEFERTDTLVVTETTVEKANDS